MYSCEFAIGDLVRSVKDHAHYGVVLAVGRHPDSYEEVAVYWRCYECGDYDNKGKVSCDSPHLLERRYND